LQPAERLFNDSVRYTKAMIYRRPAKAWIWGGLKMGPDEVIKKLEEQGVTIAARTIREWVNAGLIPKPERGRKGTGGSWADYPPETIPEALTAHLLKEVQRLRKDEIAELRQAYKKSEENISSNVWGIALTTIKSDGYKTALRRLSFAQNLAAFIAGDPDRLEKFKVLALLPEIIDTERLERDIETGVVTNDNPMEGIFNYLKPEYDKQEE
jgi:hypothetical protein